LKIFTLDSSNLLHSISPKNQFISFFFNYDIKSNFRRLEVAKTYLRPPLCGIVEIHLSKLLKGKRMLKFPLKKKESPEPAPGSGKKKKSKKQRSNQAVDRYHGPLITNEVSLGYIKFFPWLMLPFTAFLSFVAGHDDPIGIINVLFLSATIINIASLLFGLFTPLINRFKSLTYILVALVVWTVTLTFYLYLPTDGYR